MCAESDPHPLRGTRDRRVEVRALFTQGQPPTRAKLDADVANCGPVAVRGHPEPDVGDDDSSGMGLKVGLKTLLDASAQLIDDLHSLAVYRNPEWKRASSDLQFSLRSLCPGGW